MTLERLWRVAVEAPLPEALTYKSSSELELNRGMLVNVPLGRRMSKGLVLGPAESAGDFEVKAIESRDEEHPTLPENYLNWLEWMSRYYLYPPGLTAMHAYPPLKKSTGKNKTRKSPVVPEIRRIGPPSLTDEQKTCVADVLASPGFAAHLVFGVTGSGKTEVYLHLLEETLKKGQTGLVVVPEISLTPQLIERFASRFGDAIAVLHSQLTDRERTNQWWDIVEGRKKILIGARSALFCPVPNLGMIVVDEEHEPGFKQEEKLKYHGRDSAVMLGKFMNCPVILGSATPSLESWKNAQEGRYKLHTLKSRVAGRRLPEVQIIDLRKDESESPVVRDPSIPFWMSPPLHAAILETFERGDQVALFLNRRGMAHMIVCPSCGHTKECPNCDINLTLHAGSHLICHYCDYHENFKKKCSDCREGEVESIGLGTELIEQDLRKLFPNHRVSRADRDEIQNREDLEDLIRDMESGEIDILVGTQMIAKGLDFPKLTLVGLILADIGFNLPDFRATERSFQLITQMAGRSGRHVDENQPPGQVIVQTFNPEHDSLRFAIHHDFTGFAAHELAQREALKYPPLGKLVCLRIQGANLSAATEAAKKLRSRARALLEKAPSYAGIEVLGPAEAPLAKIRNQYRFQILLKGTRSDLLNSFTKKILGDEKWIPAGCRVMADVDPLQML